MSSPMTALTTSSPLLTPSGAASVGAPGDGGDTFAPVFAALFAPASATPPLLERPAIGGVALPGLPGGAPLETGVRSTEPPLPRVPANGTPLPPGGIALPMLPGLVAPLGIEAPVSLAVADEPALPAAKAAAPQPDAVVRLTPLAAPGEPVVPTPSASLPVEAAPVVAPRHAPPTPRPSRFAKVEARQDLPAADDRSDNAAAHPDGPLTPTAAVVADAPLPPPFVAPTVAPPSPVPLVPATARPSPSAATAARDAPITAASASPIVRTGPAPRVARAVDAPTAPPQTDNIELTAATVPQAAAMSAPQTVQGAFRVAVSAARSEATVPADAPTSSRESASPLPVAAAAARWPASIAAPAERPETPPVAAVQQPSSQASVAAPTMPVAAPTAAAAAKTVTTATSPVDAPRVSSSAPAERTAAAAAPAAIAATVAAAAPAILPAFRAFGAALHRAAATERRAPVAVEPIAVSTAPVLTAPLTATAPVDTTKPHWPEAMLARIEHIRDAQDAGDTRIRLHPDALGHIDIALRHEAGGVRVYLTAAEPATRAMLADAQPRLQELAEARGLKLAGSSVDGGGQSFAGERDRRAPAPSPATPRAPRPATAETDLDTDTRLA